MINQAKEQFMRAIENACKEYEKALRSERIKEGIRKAKNKKGF